MRKCLPFFGDPAAQGGEGPGCDCYLWGRVTASGKAWGWREEVNPRSLQAFPLHRGCHCFFEIALLSACAPPSSSTTPALLSFPTNSTSNNKICLSQIYKKIQLISGMQKIEIVLYLYTTINIVIRQPNRTGSKYANITVEM